MCVFCIEVKYSHYYYYSVRPSEQVLPCIKNLVHYLYSVEENNNNNSEVDTGREGGREGKKTPTKSNIYIFVY